MGNIDMNTEKMCGRWNINFDVTYDKNKYNMEYRLVENDDYDDNDTEDYISYDEYVEIVRLSDNRVIGKVDISGRLKSITQLYKNEETHFIVTEYSCIRGITVEDYVEKDCNLEFNNNFYCDDMKNINGTCFALTLPNDEGTTLYNLNTVSKPHSKVFYEGEEAKARIKENYVMVVDRIVAEENEEFEDYLTYGVDLNTYEIVTPIYSSFHKHEFNMDNTDYFVNFLNDAGKQTPKRKSLYIDGKYNEEFGNTFKRNK